MLYVLVAVPSASAQGTERTLVIFTPAPGEPTGTVERGYWAYQLGAGGRVTGKLLLQNPGTTPVTLDLQAIDAETAQAGGVAFADPTMTVRATGTWITLSQRRVKLASNRQRTVEFTVNVPQGVRPAQYLAGISATIVPNQLPYQTCLPRVVQRASDPSTPPRTVRSVFTVHSRTVLAVEVDVMGDWSSRMSISGVKLERLGNTIQARIDLKNTGDTYLRPSGKVTITDGQGRRIRESDLAMGLFVAHTSTTYIVPNVKVGTGSYTAEVVLHYGVSKVATYRSTVVLSAPAADATNSTIANGVEARLSPIVLFMYRVFTSWYQP